MPQAEQKQTDDDIILEASCVMIHVDSVYDDYVTYISSQMTPEDRLKANTAVEEARAKTKNQVVDKIAGMSKDRKAKIAKLLKSKIFRSFADAVKEIGTTANDSMTIPKVTNNIHIAAGADDKSNYAMWRDM